MRSRIGTCWTVPAALLLAGFGCNQVLGIREASSDDWDGAAGSSGTVTTMTGSSGTQTSGAGSGSFSGFTAPPTADAGNLPPPTDAATTSYAWANWPMPNPPSTGLPNPQSYDAGTNGVVYDNVTGLNWQQNVDDKAFAWSDARAYCASLSLAGSGWRLPSRIELLSLVDFTQVPTIDSNTFPSTPMDGFWSGSLLAGDASYAWSVNFGFTVTPSYDSPLNATFHVRCVR